MMAKKKLVWLIGLGLLLMALLAACGDTSSAIPAAPAATTPPATTAPVAPTSTASQPIVVSPTTAAPATTAVTTAANSSQPSAEAVVRQFVEAANRGDADAVANRFALDARFDSVGRIYQGREQIMKRFLEPEVLALGGRYEIVGVTQEGEAVTFEFNFRAGSLFEHFTYRCIVRNGQIQDVVGRYVPAQPTTAASSSGQVAVDPAVRCYVDAVNSKNLDGLVNCFAPDGLVIDVNRQIKGQEAIRTWARNEVIGGKLEVLENQPGPGRHKLLVHWSPAGSNGWKAYYTFEFKNGKLTQADLQYA